MTTPLAPRGLRVAGIRLEAVFAAVSVSREFVRKTLGDWQVLDQIDVAELLVSELVTNAVKTTAVTDAVSAPEKIGVQLRAVHTELYVEVWDGGEGSPVIPEQFLDAEGGRGLFLVESLSTRWGIYRPAAGGKIVWSELTLAEPVKPSLLAEALPVRDPGTHGPVAGSRWERVDIALVQRALDGFRDLPDLRLTG
jgi:anti-sigma regulatory factor (Ser/Thr protein kinase)